MVNINLIDKPGDYRLTISGETDKIIKILMDAGIKYKMINTMSVVSIIYPSQELIAQIIILFQKYHPRVDRKIITMLEGEFFGDFKFPKDLPLSDYQKSLIRKIFRKNLLILNDDSGTGKTHTLLGMILGSKLTFTYIAPIDVLHQIKRIISRYYRDEVFELAMKRINFLPLTKDLVEAPSSDILIIDEVHRVFNKKQLIRSISKQKYKIRILISPKNRIQNHDKKILLKLLGLSLANNPDRIIEEYTQYEQKSYWPQIMPIFMTTNLKKYGDFFRDFYKKADKEKFIKLREQIALERYQSAKSFLNKKISEGHSIAIVTSHGEVKKNILKDYPMFNLYSPDTSSAYTVFDPQEFPDSIELDHREIVSVETYPSGSLSADFVFRFHRKAKMEQVQSFYSVRCDHILDQAFVESQVFSSAKNQIRYLLEKIELQSNNENAHNFNR